MLVPSWFSFFLSHFQVSKIEVQYDKTSKQVDVQTLKETLWDHIQESAGTAFQVNQFSFAFCNILFIIDDSYLISLYCSLPNLHQ